MDFIAIHMEYMPTDSPLRQDVLAGADDLLKVHASRRAIVVSHYLMEGGSSTAFSNQGQATWGALKDNHNLFLMLYGHLEIAKRRRDTYTDTTGTTTVDTLRSDYQFQPNGGNGWLRVMTFSPENDTISVRTYSPTLGQYWVDADNEFALNYDMVGGNPFEAINAVPITVTGDTKHGTVVCADWLDREFSTSYEWYVFVSDGAASNAGPHWTFTTAGQCIEDADCDDANPCPTIAARPPPEVA